MQHPIRLQVRRRLSHEFLRRLSATIGPTARRPKPQLKRLRQRKEPKLHKRKGLKLRQLKRRLSSASHPSRQQRRKPKPRQKHPRTAPPPPLLAAPVKAKRMSQKRLASHLKAHPSIPPWLPKKTKR